MSRYFEDGDGALSFSCTAGGTLLSASFLVSFFSPASPDRTLFCTAPIAARAPCATAHLATCPAAGTATLTASLPAMMLSFATSSTPLAVALPTGDFDTSLLTSYSACLEGFEQRSSLARCNQNLVPWLH